jgi:EipB-like
MAALRTCILASCMAAAALLNIDAPARVRAQQPIPDFVAHRAVYDLKLAYSRGSSSSMSARGRILYDFSGNSCEGYALRFRQVSELDNGEGKVTLSDLRSTTWEDASANKFMFKSQNYLNEALIEAVDGEAERRADKVRVTLAKPVEKSFDLDRTIAFPTDHMRRILEAARAAQPLFETPVYDGSEKGEKVYQTLSVIGHAIAPDERTPDDAAANKEALRTLRRWPVTVSYFDRAAKNSDQPPLYSIKFELYENGISRALMLDYNDFVISGELGSLEIRTAQSCR